MEFWGAVVFYQKYVGVRIRIIFKLKNRGANLPFHHQFLLAQLVKGMLLRGNHPEFKDYSFYNFSGLKGQTKISRNGLHYYSSKVTLVLSSPNEEFVQYLLSQLFSLSQVELGNLMLVPESVEKEHTPEITEETKFICISPLVLINPDLYDNSGKRFIGPETDEFSDLLYESTMLRMEESGWYSSEQIESFFKFQVVPDYGYLRKITESQKKFARIYPVYDQDVKYEVRGYTFPFTLYAAKEVQEFVFTCGLGRFTHKGFGMLDLANQDPSARTIQYEINPELVKA